MVKLYLLFSLKKLLILNKPEGVLSSTKREKDIPIVFDFLPESNKKDEMDIGWKT